MIICVPAVGSRRDGRSDLPGVQVRPEPAGGGAPSPLPVPPYIFICITVFLGLVRLVHRRRINPTRERPPIEVIIPAFNEELNIAQLLGRSMPPRRATRARSGCSCATTDPPTTRSTRLRCHGRLPLCHRRGHKGEPQRASQGRSTWRCPLPRRLRLPGRCRLPRPRGLLLVLGAPLPGRSQSGHGGGVHAAERAVYHVDRPYADVRDDRRVRHGPAGE